MHKRPTAGQATTEYIAVIALLAAVFVLAAPAVGAPSIGRLVIEQMQRALCIAGMDICDAQMAREAGLAPCPMGSDLTGREVSATAFSIEVGHRWTLTVTPNSDGTVSIMRTASGHAGVVDGFSPELSLGPVKFEVGGEAGAKARVQGAYGWTFPNQAAADEFIESNLKELRADRWPQHWVSVEGSGEVSAMVGLALGGDVRERLDLVGFSGSGHGAIGARLVHAGNVVTVYGRATLDGPELARALMPTIGRGREDWVVEYTFDGNGPRELAFRRVEPSDRDSRQTETVARLDLRDPTNAAAARPLLDARLPWGPEERAAFAVAGARIASHGTIERTVSSVSDDSRGISGSVRGGAKFGGSAKKIDVHRSLVEASARTGGYDRRRLDCQVPSK
ncbi:hypothetical protein OJ997_01220 [Solirubrobacter phytolaccae]|uniref:Uncharacterized protein n=1 Tax=Solirubrobacter phytolaccae TaxID=1404360 RepID=A0A9X3N371_9ACTN|nr:hypothetical protein [Solirubrobacter phytolaccae]MDA0178898.1 hypothetical protein [Solirubrobacter phytolaccae]